MKGMMQSLATGFQSEIRLAEPEHVLLNSLVLKENPDKIPYKDVRKYIDFACVRKTLIKRSDIISVDVKTVLLPCCFCSRSQLYR